MIELLYNVLTTPQSLAAIAAAVGVFATIMVVTAPILARDNLNKRMKGVASERERIRQRERARLADNNRGDNKGKTRREQQQAFMQNIVQKLDLRKMLDDGSLSMKLAMGGLRGPRPVTVFLFARFALPFIFFVGAAIYVFGLNVLEGQPFTVQIAVCLAVAYLGFMAPNIYLKNVTQKRQQSIQRAFPDALDLLLICVESGMSVEAAFKRVSNEVGQDSQALAEEFALTTAELSFLENRSKAYENLAARTGLDGVKACVLALTQAEKYGTPLGSALRVMAQENRDMRMTKAEQKAASLPPKLTVPMIVFFLPVLFMIIAGPVIIRLIEDGYL